MDWEPGEGEDDDHDHDHFDDTLLVPDGLGAGPAPRGLVPQPMEHHAVQTADKEQWQHVGSQEKRDLQNKIIYTNH